jgi:hypothetical protein
MDTLINLVYVVIPTSVLLYVVYFIKEAISLNRHFSLYKGYIDSINVNRKFYREMNKQNLVLSIFKLNLLKKNHSYFLMKSEIHELINEAKDKLKALRMKDD